jgi:hypothetical protein
MLILAAGSALAACGICVAASPFPAHAIPAVPLAPPCNDYQFPAGYVLLLEPTTKFSIRFEAPPTPGRSFRGVTVDATDKSGKRLHGTGDGGINGRNIHLTVNWDSGEYQNYLGQLGDDGVAHGRTQNNHPDQSGVDWQSVSTAFDCMPDRTPKGPPIAAPDDPTTGVSPAPPANQSPPVISTGPNSRAARITGDVDVYAEPGGVGSPVSTVTKGTIVTVLQRRDDNWVQLADIGWVWGDFVSGHL